MGRIDQAASRVQAHATQLLQNTRHTYPPPWLAAIQTTPPAQNLVRPVLRRAAKPGKRSARMFSPVNLTYEEDRLRWEYFNDHPWELARPRVVLENDGRDAEKWNWSVELDVALNRPREGRPEMGRTVEEWETLMRRQAARPLNGESVIQRQHYLLSHTGLSAPAAYDKARKELYRIRHYQETELRVAREEAENVGAFFGLGPLEVGMKLEDRAYENWKAWAIKETEALKQLQSGAYTGNEEADEETAPSDTEGSAAMEVLRDGLPESSKGKALPDAFGDAVAHP